MNANNVLVNLTRNHLVIASAPETKPAPFPSTSHDVPTLFTCHRSMSIWSPQWSPALDGATSLCLCRCSTQRLQYGEALKIARSAPDERSEAPSSSLQSQPCIKRLVVAFVEQTNRLCLALRRVCSTIIRSCQALTTQSRRLQSPSSNQHHPSRRRLVNALKPISGVVLTVIKLHPYLRRSHRPRPP